MRGIVPIVLGSAGLVTLATVAFAENRTYDFDGFSKVSVAAGVEVNITTGQDYALSAEALRGDLDQLVIDQHGDAVVIRRKRPLGLLGALRRDRFVVTIAMPELTGADTSSGASLSATGTGLQHLTAEASSGSSLSVEGMQGDALQVQATSGASVTLAGSCQHIVAEASSGASIDAEALICASGDFAASSGASIDGYASDSVAAEVSSGASVDVSGHPKVHRQKVSSGGSFDVS